MNQSKTSLEKEIDELQQESFNYILNETNLENGLVLDRTDENWPASIAATGLALSAYAVGVERGYLSRDEARKRTLTTLKFLSNSPQGTQPDATGYKGFYYHFLDMKTGKRAWQSELSTVDSALLIAGVLSAGIYFNGSHPDERQIGSIADELYQRVDWDWARNGGDTVTHGWKPESGFLDYRWQGYDEAMILYILGLGSPTHALPERSYMAWASTYQWDTAYGYDYLYAGPLFTHQLSHIWVDFRKIQDDFMREKGIDYFENSRRATYVQQRYAIENPLRFKGYNKTCWGLSASDGPGPATLKINGIQRTFSDYIGRGVPFGPDDGTIAPWAVVASLPFAPEIVLPAMDYFIHDARLKDPGPYGFKATFNATFPTKTGHKCGWISKYHYGLNQGPIVLMIENHRCNLLWQLMRHCPYIVTGLRRAGFQGGWL